MGDQKRKIMPVLSIYEARLFYEKQGEGVGDYFFDSIFSDIDSLALYGGIHPKFYEYHRMLSKRFPYAAYYTVQEREIVVVHRVLDLRQHPKMIQRERGDLLVPLGDARHCREFAANVFWFSGRCCSGDSVMIRCVTQETSAMLVLENKFDPAEIEKRIDKPDCMEIGEIAKVRVCMENDIVVDPFTSIPEMGRFVIERCGIPVGGGIVL